MQVPVCYFHHRTSLTWQHLTNLREIDEGWKGGLCSPMVFQWIFSGLRNWLSKNQIYWFLKGQVQADGPIKKGFPIGFPTLTLYSLCWTAALLAVKGKKKTNLSFTTVEYAKGRRAEGIFCRKSRPAKEGYIQNLMSCVQTFPWAPITSGSDS